MRPFGGKSDWASPLIVGDLEKPVHLKLKQGRLPVLNPPPTDHIADRIQALQFSPCFNSRIRFLCILQIVLTLKIQEELRRCIKGIPKQTCHIWCDRPLS